MQDDADGVSTGGVAVGERDTAGLHRRKATGTVPGSARSSDQADVAASAADQGLDKSGTTGGKKWRIDYREPLVKQVGELGVDYMEWVHTPEVMGEPQRFFSNPFMEMMSRTYWWVVPLVWLPIALIAVFHALVRLHTPLWVAVPAFGVGIYVWEFLEYTLHRFLFHSVPTNKRTITSHFILHGCHHKHPMDHFRLVFPPIAAAPIIFGNLALFLATMSPGIAYNIFGGALCGYVVYDCTHYFLHHKTFAADSRLARLKTKHMKHHYKDATTGFGVSSDLFDKAMGTLPSRD